MGKRSCIDIDTYNEFCEGIHEGDILYNVNKTNNWGEYFLVVNIATVRIGEYKTYTALLLGLRKEKSKLVPRNARVKLTPDSSDNVPYLKCVGKCKFTLVPTIEETDLNLGLATVYGNADLWKFSKNLSVRKPRKKKYGNDGKPIVRKAGSD